MYCLESFLFPLPDEYQSQNDGHRLPDLGLARTSSIFGYGTSIVLQSSRRLSGSR